MRLIDADELKNAISDVVREELPEDKKWAKGLEYSLKIIDNAPTIEPRIEYGTDGQPYRLFMSGGQVVPDNLQVWRYEESPQA